MYINGRSVFDILFQLVGIALAVGLVVVFITLIGMVWPKDKRVSKQDVTNAMNLCPGGVSSVRTEYGGGLDISCK